MMRHRALDDLVRVIDLDGASADPDKALTHEWLVTNGIGGYASGTVAGANTRRFHGLLVAALPNPLGRIMMLNRLHETVQRHGADPRPLAGFELETGQLEHDIRDADSKVAFRLEGGLPVWEYETDGLVVEKRVVMPHGQNTSVIRYRLLDGADEALLTLAPAVHFRPHEARLDAPEDERYVLSEHEGHFALELEGELPPLRMWIDSGQSILDRRGARSSRFRYRVEARRGYDHFGTLWVPCTFQVPLQRHEPAYFTASVEDPEVARALMPGDVLPAEHTRRRRLLQLAGPASREPLGAELVLAADQFLVRPVGRTVDVMRAAAFGDQVRTVIAGYHWFTDWGRDTMISLEGLTLATGRYEEAGYILRTFARYERDGLIPNMFPEGERDGLYHTADASLWYFHAVNRYLRATKDRWTLRVLLPTLERIVRHHVEGTRFGIAVDPGDGLLTQGEQGYQLTWMDAKVGDWVVTPRRGKAVELNALWYNALCLLEGWLRTERGDSRAEPIAEMAARARESFNRRFWYSAGSYCYDVIDGEQGDDSALRPNQLLAISLDNPILSEDRWHHVISIVHQQLVTPVGLRSLAPGQEGYRERYDGDLRARDAAYHQGTVWAWLIGPWVDAWLRVRPDDLSGARSFLDGFDAHLSDFGAGSIAEIFDAEEPYTPRGCIAQAWSVAEVLRCLVKTGPAAMEAGRP